MKVSDPRLGRARSPEPGLPEPAFPEPRAPELDCLTCGACCYQRAGTILVSEHDLVRWKRAGRDDILQQLDEGHFGQKAFAMAAGGACVHHGTEAGPHACRIYADRGDTCREFEAGSWQCLEFRRDRGIDPPRPGAPPGTARGR